MTDTKALTPSARLHDIGEMTVINDDHGRVHHHCAMVLIFDDRDQAAACMEAGVIHLVPAQDLNANATEHLTHG
ncbi:hypothetical protein [Marinobacter sp. NFXS9]|uniref:hypothetical protein n=1 Tax=Marinobacter sp. NFXS9 TaxID=2818433 RepID=UPI0032DF7372